MARHLIALIVACVLVPMAHTQQRFGDADGTRDNHTRDNRTRDKSARADAPRPAAADTATPPGKSKRQPDIWEAAYIQNARAGYVHTFTEEIERDGKPVLRTTTELRLHLKRNGSLIQLGMDTGTLELPDGEVIGVFMTQYMGTKKAVEIVGVVEGDMVRLTLDHTKPLKPAPWRPDVIGMGRQRHLFRDKNLQPGDTFAYATFEPSINLVVQTHVKIGDFEKVELHAGKEHRRLLRVLTTPEKVDSVQVPPLTQWLDEDLLPVRSQVEIPGLGVITTYRTTEADAKARTSVASLKDVGLGQMVPLSRRIVQPFSTSLARYQVTIRGDEDVGSAFAQDMRQRIVNVHGNSFELWVQSSQAVEKAAEAGAEFTQSCYFINSEDPVVKGLAKKAVIGEKDDWRKALRIERWVHTHMVQSNTEAFAPADRVARTLQGDCTEHAMLAAAMCRAEGIPSRTALGLVYAETRGRPGFGFHMWTEVFIDGTWRPIDATLGRGGLAATHLKISDQSWHDTRSMTPLLPVVRILGKLSIEVVGYRHGDGF